MQILAAAIAGLLFGIGLTVSGMVNPKVVLGFLDVAGHWDPALLFVMVGALAVAMPGYWLVTRRKPVFAPEHRIPLGREIDPRLIAGSAIFGAGWGLGGICPGPALAMLAIRPSTAILFVAAMTVGMLVAGFLSRR